MKYKVLTTLAISLFSMNAFSYKIISKEFHSSPGAHGGFIVKQDEIRKLPELSKNELKKNALNPMIVSATAYNSNGRVATNIRVNGSHKYCIDNYSSQAIQAGFRFSLATLGEDVHQSETFILGSHESRCVTQDSFMVVYPRGSGNFTITAFTTGQDGSSTKVDRNNATLSVSD
jgi:hypothetical protein